MKIIKNIFKTLFLFTIIISFMKVYGYNLVYTSELDRVNGMCAYIFTPVQAHGSAVEDYETRTKVGGWVMATPDDKNTTGGDFTFATSYYVFYSADPAITPVPTKYNSGFDKDPDNETNNNIYYDQYSVAGKRKEIDYRFTSVNSFTGVEANIPEYQGTNTHNFVRLSKKYSDGYVDCLKWKIVGGETIITVYKLTNKAIELLTDSFSPEELNGGIRFSNVLNTQYDGFPSHLEPFRTYMDTAWLYFQLTIGNGWDAGGRGFNEAWTKPDANDVGTYKQGASVANEYDNILKIQVPIPSIKRQIYINHVDEDGNILPGFQNNTLNLINDDADVVGTRASTEPKAGFQEHYIIEGTERIAVVQSSKNKIGEFTYKFLRGESSKSTDFAIAKNGIAHSTYIWTKPEGGYFRTSQDLEDDFVVINMVYEKIPPPPTVQLVNLQLVGRLEFINRDSAYLGSTSGGDLDYIPSTKQLTPFAQGAYPYIVRALRYESKNETKSSSTTVTTYINYTWDVWTYSHGSAQEIADPGHPASAGPPVVSYKAPTFKHKHDSTCDWYRTTRTATSNEVFNYNVPYKHTWFQITNFKMYRISKMDVYDNAGNAGGKLFNGEYAETYVINPSGTYEARFNNSRGKINKTLTVDFPSKSYYLTSVYEPLTKPSGGTETSSGTSKNSQSTAAATAASKLAEVNNEIAANHENLTITYQYDNDYVELDGMTNMLQRNYKTWSEHIIKETDSNVRDLDSTKNGTGKTNGSALSYTYNLMSYMKPTIRLTTDIDFTPNYQTVLSYRENGIRELRGKIYYALVTDFKYNVGLNSFDSTDATYRLNNIIRLTDIDFTPQNKVYAGNDVNRVNVLTPISFGNFELITDRKVDHTTGAGSATILQKNADFTITPTTAGSSTGGYNLSDTREFVKGYYFMFDFNIIYNGTKVGAYNPIYIEGRNASLTAKTTDSFASGSADQITNSIKIVAVTTNITNALKEYMDYATYFDYGYMDYDNNKTRNTSVQNQYNFLSRTDIVSDAYHAIYKIITTKNIGRIFDFSITDCNDLAYKDIFKTTSAGNINQSTGLSYYSGYKKWNLYSQTYNEMINRTDISSTPQNILPLGPYKNTNTKYINAPKMGYRIGFDLKTTGYMAANNINNSRRVEITPRYYYISKDGKTFDNNIKLYFKNANSNYVNFASSGYTIYYKPNDGYRYLRNSMYTDNYTLMSTKLEPLTISNKLVLTNKMMSTNNTSFIQAWYGEFKLPNSTIAISNAVGNPNNNINNPYEDGYIGVIFDIKCIDSAGFILSYDTSDKSSGSTVNTSQWDYEGYMNFKTPGVATNTLRYQLEKDIWEIDNARYQNVKGTVVLFDLDNRAANDFE